MVGASFPRDGMLSAITNHITGGMSIYHVKIIPSFKRGGNNMGRTNLAKFIRSIAQWVAQNPQTATNIGVSAAAFAKFMTLDNVKAIVAIMAKEVAKGKSYKDALAIAVKSKAAKALGVAAGKTACVAAASAIAIQTWKAGYDQIAADVTSKDKTGWEKIVSLGWHSSPLGATVDLVKRVGSWLTKSDNQRAKESDDQVSANQTKEQQVNMKAGIDYDETAKSLGMVPRPKGSGTAETEWKKEVERNMNKKNTKPSYNSPDWYFKGLASKILGTTVTWSGVKAYHSKINFLGACGLHVNLLIPQDSNMKIHSQIIANTNILWQALRGKNTGAFNYTESDVYNYQILLSSMIAVARFVGKLISLSNKYDVEVSQLPTNLYAVYANSMSGGANTGEIFYKDVIANKPLYVTRLNSIIKQINTYALPGTSLISRWNYLADKCIRDYNGDKAIFGYYILDYVPAWDTGNGYVVYGDIKNRTITQLLDHLQGQLDAFRNIGSGVMLKVAGDMIKLLGAGKETFENAPYYTGSEEPKFEYDPEAFDQIRNAKVLHITAGRTPTYDMSVTGVLECTVTASNSATVSLTNNYAIDTLYTLTSDRNKEFSHKENLQMIQFCFNASASSNKISITDCGTSMIDHITCSTYKNDGTIEVFNIVGYLQVFNGTDDAAALFSGFNIKLGSAGHSYLEWVDRLIQLDFCPRLQFVKVPTSGSMEFQDMRIDYDNYAFMTNDQYHQLNNVAVYSQTFTFNPSDVKIVGLLS